MSRLRSASSSLFLLSVVLIFGALQAAAVVPTAPSIAVSPSSNPAASGTVLTLTATLSGGTGSYSGRVRFTSNGALLGYAKVIGLSATFKTNQLAPGGYIIGATYFGDASNSIPNQATASLTVMGSTTTTISSSPNPSFVGTPIQFTGTVATTAAGSPTGTVSFQDTDFVPSTEIGSGTLGTVTGSMDFAFRSLSGAGAFYGNSEKFLIADVDGDGIPDLIIAGASAVYTAHGNGDGTFGTIHSTTTGSYPYFCSPVNVMAVADVNRDGKLDLIGGCSGYPWALVFYGNGDGTFQSISTVLQNGTQGVESIVTGDFNGDGITDLAFAQGNAVSIWLGDGNGGFTLSQSIPSPAVQALVLGDFNEDGYLDIAGANFSYPGSGVDLAPLVVYYGAGDGTFAPTEYGAADGFNFAISIATADFNGDNNPDIVLASTSGGVEVFSGDGTGNFSGQIYNAAKFTQIAVMDVNGDGNPDIVGVYNPQSGNTGYFRVMYSDGSGTFSNSTVDTPLTVHQFDTMSFAIGDLDGGGRPDIVMDGVQDTNYQPAVYTGLSKAIASASCSTSGLGFGVFLIDANYEGDVVFNPSTSTALAQNVTLMPTVALVNTPSTSSYGSLVQLTAQVSGAVGTPTGTVSFYDGSTLLGSSVLDGSGMGSIGTYSIGGGTRSITARYGGDPMYGALTSAPNTITVSRAAVTVSVTDDGVRSVGSVITFTASLSVFSGAPSGTVAFYSDTALLGSAPYVSGAISGSAKLKTASVGPGSHTISAKYLGDSNFSPATGLESVTMTGRPTATMVTSDNNPSNGGDNVTFTATVSSGVPGPAFNGTVKVLDNGTAFATLPIGNLATGYNSVFTMGSNLGVVRAGDFTGDGRPDFVSTESPGIMFYKNNGDGTFTSSHVGSSICPRALTVADLNNDGKLDLMWIDVCLGGPSYSLVVVLGNGDGTFQSSHAYLTGSTSSQSITVADLNGDGFPDVILGNNNDGSVSILLNQGNGTFGANSIVSSTGVAYSVAAGDLNGDGKMDLVVANTSDTTVSILLGNGDGTFQPRTTIPGLGYPQQVLLADFDGDGILDLIVGQGGYLFQFKGVGDGTFTPFTSGVINSSMADLQAIDVDGDGKLDLLDANAGGNSIHILYGNGDLTFGNETNIPAGANVPLFVSAADFNGGGKMGFVIGSAYFGQGAVYLWQQTGSAQSVTAALDANTHPITASYSLDSSYSGSSSDTLSQVVNLTSTTTSLNLSSTTPLAGHPFTATAAVNGTSTGTPTGTVTFTVDSGAVYSTVALTGNSAVFSNSSLALGAHTIVAQYNGESRFNTSTSSQATFTVWDFVAHVISPANGATNVDASSPVQVSWTSVQNPQAYYLYVGTTVGGTNVYLSGSTTNTSAMVPNLNANTTYYLRLFTKQNNGWSYVDSTFSTGNLGKSSVISSPANGATNVDASSPVTITWVGGQNVATNYLYVGTTVGSANVYGSGEVTVKSEQVKLQPSTTYYCRIFTKNTSNSWSYTDSSFTTGTQGVPAAIITPSNGATNIDGSTPISVTWNTAPGAITYFLYVGTTVGASDVYASGETTNTSASLTRFINPSTTYYVRLFTKFGIGWKYRDTTFTTGAQQLMAFVTSPTNGATGVSHPSVTINWSTATSPQAYFLYVGTTLGAKDVYGTGQTLNTQATVNGLSASTTYYLRMWTKNSAGVWHYNDTTFTTGP